jgi:phenylpropionate dioxygenase-like ring-hydroxylating dioxygenase large terminal subunit
MWVVSVCSIWYRGPTALFQMYPAVITVPDGGAEGGRSTDVKKHERGTVIAVGLSGEKSYRVQRKLGLYSPIAKKTIGEPHRAVIPLGEILWTTTSYAPTWITVEFYLLSQCTELVQYMNDRTPHASEGFHSVVYKHFHACWRHPDGRSGTRIQQLESGAPARRNVI